MASGPVQARLIAASDAVGTGEPVSLGLDVKLAPGWKTYWRQPGDAGLPPRLDWAGSTNLAETKLAFPAPRRFSVAGFQMIGYEDHVLFPIEARLAKPGQAATFALNADILVCRDVCIPEKLRLSLDLPEGMATPGADAAALATATAIVPDDGTRAGWTLKDTRWDGKVLETRLTSTKPFEHPDLFVESDPPQAFGAPAVERSADGRDATIRVAASETPPPDWRADSVSLTVVDGSNAATFTPARSDPTPPASVAQGDDGTGADADADQGVGFGSALLAALIGGILLNLMPCVLPVLSLKLLSVVSLAQQPAAAVRRGFLATAAGILTSFLILALALIGLQAAGAEIGWGIQFQSPIFLVAMILITLAFAANLAGVFTISLPAIIADRLGGPAGEGLAGAFSTGLLATLLATPCSAPFVGTAVGFALASSAGVILAVFVALGIGLASPWLAVAAYPRLVRWLPRPGRWMIGLKRVLAGALTLTALWLGSVVVHVIEVREVTEAEGSGWQPFNPTAITDAVAAGRTVFVDVGADWCLTCIANERLVLGQGAVASRLSGPSVLAMRADWTRGDPAITAFLAEHGRRGVPFNVVYGPGAPDGRVLPELLTPGIVLKALDAAARG